MILQWCASVFIIDTGGTRGGGRVVCREGVKLLVIVRLVKTEVSSGSRLG